jgi:hypothetical protein
MYFDFGLCPKSKYPFHHLHKLRECEKFNNENFSENNRLILKTCDIPLIINILDYNITVF